MGTNGISMGFKLKFDKTDILAFLILASGTLLYVGLKKSDTKEKIGGHEAVDLGLSVKWATENVGCCPSAPKGSFYSWGVNELPDGYRRKNYKWVDQLNDQFDKIPYTVNKYCTDSVYGLVDNLVQVEPADDPVVTSWGEGWRTPTYAELRELFEKCKWEFIRNWDAPGNCGMKVTGPNGNYIFLPMLGYNKSAYEHPPYGDNVYGCYWSASLESKRPLAAMCLYFTNSSYEIKSMYRFLGFSVRPVIDK